MDIAEDEPELTRHSSSGNVVKKGAVFFDDSDERVTRKVDRMPMLGDADTEPKTKENEKKMGHNRSQSTLGQAKQNSVFLLLNNEDAEAFEEEKQLLELKARKEQEDQKREEDSKKNMDFIEIDSYDFLYKKTEPYLKKLFENEKSTDVFSDTIYIYDCAMVRSKLYYDLIVTNKNIYLLNANRDILKSIFKLENLFRITVSSKNYNLLVSF